MLALGGQACNLVQRNVPTATLVPSVTAPLPSEPAAARPSRTPIPAPTLAITASPTLAIVTVTAAKGNLFIRRGPDLGFNPVSVLMDGQSAQALARDVLARWVQIPIPGHPERTGWVSIQSHYSLISGNVMDLPEIEPTDWPVLPYLRNCTHHQMQLDPGEIVLPPVDLYPDNEISVNPGFYRILDIDVQGHPVVLEVNLSEGAVLDIREDGTGEGRKCPES